MILKYSNCNTVKKMWENIFWTIIFCVNSFAYSYIDFQKTKKDILFPKIHSHYTNIEEVGFELKILIKNIICKNAIFFAIVPEILLYVNFSNYTYLLQIMFVIYNFIEEKPHQENILHLIFLSLYIQNTMIISSIYLVLDMFLFVSGKIFLHGLENIKSMESKISLEQEMEMQEIMKNMKLESQANIFMEKDNITTPRIKTDYNFS